jgi:hypothetical protein
MTALGALFSCRPVSAPTTGGHELARGFRTLAPAAHAEGPAEASRAFFASGPSANNVAARSRRSQGVGYRLTSFAYLCLFAGIR